MKKKYKFLKKKNILFSQVFSIKEKEKKKEKDSNEEDSKEEKSNSSKEDSNSKEESNSKESKKETESNEDKSINKNMSKSRITIGREKKDNIVVNPVTILIYKNTKKESILCRSNQTLYELFKYLNEKKYLSNSDKEKNNFKILYGLEQLKIDDKRKIYEIISDKKINKPYEKENQIRIIIKNKDNDYNENKKFDKIYISLENIPSFMDLSEQINIFINKYKNEDIKYDIKYINNCCIITFYSPEISFSFVTFMTNLKFKNKYYRKLIVKMKYNNYNLIKKNNLLNRNPILQRDQSIILLNSKNNNVSKSNITNITNITNQNSISNIKSNSYDRLLVKTEPNQINDYFTDRYRSINEYTPYDEEKLLNKLEKEKNKKKWITYKGFFSGVNKKSFNRFINPYNNKISLANIGNYKERKIFFDVNNK